MKKLDASDKGTEHVTFVLPRRSAVLLTRLANQLDVSRSEVIRAGITCLALMQKGLTK